AQRGQDLLGLGAIDHQLVEERLRPGLVAGRLDGEELTRERLDRRAELLRHEGEAAIGPGSERARVEEPVELDRGALAVRLVQAEADRTKHPGEVRGPERLSDLGWELALGDEALHRPETDDVCLALLDGAGELLDLGPGRGLPSIHDDLLRTDAVHQLVHEDLGEERIELYGLQQ